MRTPKTIPAAISVQFRSNSCSAAQAHSKHLIVAMALLAGALVSPVSSLASESLSTDGHPVSAAVNLGIVIPAVLRVVEDSHPRLLSTVDTPTSRVSASQHMVLVSTLGKGFCMDLQLTQRRVADWRVQVSGSAGTRVRASERGYRVCASHAGRYELELQHDFSLQGNTLGETAPALDWPVSMSLTAL
ncbi:MAG: hypothetical protein PHR71_08875 [Polaromonas sp.]|nr:hypothetical protein [Polaromonas sp.]